MIDICPVSPRRHGALRSLPRYRLLQFLFAACSIGCGDEGEPSGLSAQSAQSAEATDTESDPAAAAADELAQVLADAGATDADASSGDAGTAAAPYDPCPPAPEPCKVLPLGDSITLGVGFNGGYRVELFRKALAAKQKITFVGSMSNGPATVDGVAFPKSHEGRPAWKINQLVPIVPSPALNQKPHIILLMIGTNDVARPNNVADAPRQLGALIDKLIANVPDALIVVSNLVPMTFSDVKSYNAALPAVVEARAKAGKHVKLVDMFTGFPTSLLGDGVHPNQKGYAQMAGVWYDAIAPVLH